MTPPNKPLAERLREYADWTEDSGAAALLTEAADELDRRPEPHRCADPECMDCG